jgi:hypothetical protein
MPELRAGSGIALAEDTTAGTLTISGGPTINLGSAPFNAHLNGTDDDRPAFAAAVASLGGNGGTIEWNGYLRFNSGYTAPAGKSHIRLKPIGNSPFYNPAHGFTFITLPSTVASWDFHGVGFQTDTGASGATEVFLIDSACDNLVTRDLYGVEIWSGLRLTGSKQFIENRTYFQDNKPTSGRFVVINQGTNEICEIENLIAINGTDCAVGVEINSGSAVKLGGIVAKGGIPLKLNPGSGQVIATLVLNEFNGDTSSGHGCWLTGAGTIQRLRGSATFSGCAGTGMRVDTPAQSADLWLRLQQNTVNGLTLAGVDHHESRFRIAAYGNGTHGFEALNNASKFTIEGVAGAGDGFGGNLAYGAVIGTGCDNFTLDINGSGNGTGLFFNSSGTSTTKVIRSRG